MPPEVKTIKIDKIAFQQTLDKKLADLPPFPAMVTKIMQVINDPDKGADEVSRLVSMDGGLCSKILRIVNSAYYGFPKRISTVTHAVMVLGFNTVRNLVLGVTAFGMMPPKTIAAGLNRTRFWEHSVATAVAASVIAKKRVPNNRTLIEEAFIAGLLHDFGKLFVDCYFPVQYAVCMAFAQREKIQLIEAERRVLDFVHTAVGRRIAEHWNFPQPLMAAIAYHHSPELAGEHFDMAAIVMVANRVVWEQGKGSSDMGGPPDLSDDIVKWLGFSEDDYSWVIGEWRRQFAAAKDMLNIAQEAAA